MADHLFVAAIVFFILALIASLLATFTRLRDARTTAHIVREEGKSMTEAYIARLRSKAKFWGKWTWRLLSIQLITFSLGAFLFLIALWLIFESKLFPIATSCP